MQAIDFKRESQTYWDGSSAPRKSERLISMNYRRLKEIWYKDWKQALEKEDLRITQIVC